MKQKQKLAILVCLVLVLGSALYNWYRPESRFIQAVSHNDTNRVRVLLETYPKLRHYSRSDMSPLHISAEKGYLSMVELLLSYHFSVDCRDVEGATPLDKAVWLRKLSVVRALLSNKASIHSRDRNGRTALHYAAAASTADLSMAFTGAVSGSDMTQQVQDQQTQIASALIDAYANVNAVSNVGRTALQSAAISGNVQLAKLLIKHGANVTAQDKKGNAAIHYAARYGSVELVKLLTHEGANISIKNGSSESPLDWAMKKHRSDIVPLLK